MQQVVEVLGGSRLYGCNLKNSDYDVKFVILPDAKDILLGIGKDAWFEDHKEENATYEYFTLKKYLKMLSEGQSIAVEMFFAPTKYQNLLWKKLKEHKSELLSNKISAMVGYCVGQSSKYGVKGKRMDAAQKMYYFLENLGDDFELLGKYYKEIEEYIYWQHNCSPFISVENIPQPGGDTVPHLSVCGKKASFTITVKEALKIFNRLINMYGERTQKSQENNGADLKSLMHAVRVGRQAIEFLQTGELKFPSASADYYLKIRAGEVSGDEIAEEIDNILGQIYKLQSTLPDEANQRFIDKFIIDAYKKVIINS